MSEQGRTVHLSASRPMQALDFDPCPGDVQAVRALSEAVAQRGEVVAAATAKLAGWQPAAWQGDAADRALAQVLSLAEAARTLRRSFEAAAAALQRWAARLLWLQDEADVLDRLAAANRAELASLEAASPVGPPAIWTAYRHEERARLDAELQSLKDRAGALHRDYVAISRRSADDLDQAAPRDLGPWAGAWRTAWDWSYDNYSHGLRQQAGIVDWWATAIGHVSTVAGFVAFYPPFTPVAAAVSAATALASTRARVSLAIGAGGSVDAVQDALLGSALAVIGMRPLAGVVSGGAMIDDMATVGGLAQGAKDLLPTERSGPSDRTVTTPSGDLDVTVHDVAEPWEIGQGDWGQGFAGVATVPVTMATRPAGADSPKTELSKTDPNKTGPGKPDSGERNAEDRVGRGRT